jgi:hypothetical protein
VSATPTCEVVVRWPTRAIGERYAELCERVAVARYPAADGSHTHLCMEHVKLHEEYANPFYAGESE